MIIDNIPIGTLQLHVGLTLAYLLQLVTENRFNNSRMGFGYIQSDRAYNAQ